MLTAYFDGEASGASNRGRSAEAEALEALAQSDAHTAMGALPAGIRDAVYFTIVEGYSYAETAAMLDVPLGTATSRVCRGRKWLRIALSPVDASAP